MDQFLVLTAIQLDRRNCLKQIIKQILEINTFLQGLQALLRSLPSYRNKWAF
jgi:hypothetical protein